MGYYKYLRPFLFLLPEEFSHNLSINYLKYLSFKKRSELSHILENHIFDMYFTNPVGLAAGYDKNAEVFSKLYNYNFGFIECGTVTPEPQIGNEKPRLFRLKEDNAIINRFGFNNVGMLEFQKNFTKGKNKIPAGFPIGINIGKNKHQEDFLSDYLTLVERFYPVANYLTINISSPNTPNLRDIQSLDNLDTLARNIRNLSKRLEKDHNKKIPILYKIAPDQTEESLQDICLISTKYKFDGLIISNTTTTRPELLKSKNKNESGGLSGKPLKTLANRILSEIYIETDGKIPLIGVGGIDSADDAYYRILNGASLVQIYSGLIYKGLDLANQINKELAYTLKINGFMNVSEAIGSGININPL
ncbi:MAG: quinone-dependent dihydroorotate dehydrogenase [Rickettsiales bacterium]|jgi:dihydroorotate dehydrogenase|nr:quinone-dependent dihydroorotate dehydrogenase [Rickettsiales bacterium]